MHDDNDDDYVNVIQCCVDEWTSITMVAIIKIMGMKIMMTMLAILISIDVNMTLIV